MANRSLGTLTIDMVLKTLGFEQGLDKAARNTQKRTKEIQSAISGSFKAAAAGVTAFVAGLGLVNAAFDGLKQSIDAADQLDELSNRFNISTEQLSAWGYAARLTGSDLESMTSAIPKFSKVIADAADSTSQSAKIFEALGISVKDQAGNLRTFQDLLPEIADRFKGITDQTLKTNLALQLFGKSGAQFLEFLSLGSDGLKTMEDRAKSLGIVISGETASSAAEFNDRLDDLKAATQGFFTQVAAELLPTLKQTVVQFTSLVKSGELVSNTVTVISAALNAGVGIIAGYNRAVYGLTLTIEAAVEGFLGLAEAQANLTTLGAANGGVVEGLNRIRAASDNATASWNAYNKAQDAAAKQAANPFSGVTGRVLGQTDYDELKKQGQAAKDAAESQRKLQNLLADPTGGKKARDEAEALQKQYESLTASMKEQIALFGETSKEAKIRYDLENTELSKLTQAQKDSLIVLAQQADAQERLSELQKAADEEVKRQDDARRQQIEDADTQIRQMQQEFDLLGMTNKQRAVAIELSHLGAEATEEQRKQVEDLAKAYQDELEKISVMDDLRDSFKDFFADVISGNKSIKDSFKDMLESIGNMIAQRIAQNWVDQLFGQSGTSQTGSAGGWGQWISTFASWFAGGRANGGWADANSVYEVNERGIEMASVGGRDYMLTGNQPVHITPNHALKGGGLSQVNNFVINGRIDRRTEQQIASDTGRNAQRAIGRGIGG